MGATPKLIPKRKLISPTEDDQDINSLLQHFLNNQQSVIPQTYRSLTVASEAPIIYFNETDQADPAGRWRLTATGAGFAIQRALTAAWATSVSVLTLDATNAYSELAGPGAAGVGKSRITAGTASTTMAYVEVGTSAAIGVDIRTNNGSGSNISRITVGTGASSPTVAFGSCAVQFDAHVTMSNGFRIKTGSTANDLFYIGTPDVVFITVTNAATDSCKLTNITMDGTWLANGTVTLPALTLGGTLTIGGQTLSGAATFDAQIISTVAAGSPFLKANATSDVPTATWGAAAGNEVSAAPSGWLEIQDGSNNTRYIPFWA